MKDGDKIALNQSVQASARVSTLGQLSRGGFKKRKFGGRDARELDVANANEHIGDAVVETRNIAARPRRAQVLDATGDAVLHQECLQSVGDLVGHASVGSNFPMK